MTCPEEGYIMNIPSRQHFGEGSGMGASLYSFYNLDTMVSDSSASSPSAVVSSGRRGSKKVSRIPLQSVFHRWVC